MKAQAHQPPAQSVNQQSPQVVKGPSPFSGSPSAVDNPFHQNLLATATALQAGGDVCELLATGSHKLESDGFIVDYFELRDELTLAPLTNVDQNRPARLLAAAWLGKTRLIDNVALSLREPFRDTTE